VGAAIAASLAKRVDRNDGSNSGRHKQVELGLRAEQVARTTPELQLQRDSTKTPFLLVFLHEGCATATLSVLILDIFGVSKWGGTGLRTNLPS
jgi:hypothetical protein